MNKPKQMNVGCFSKFIRGATLNDGQMRSVEDSGRSKRRRTTEQSLVKESWRELLDLWVATRQGIGCTHHLPESPLICDLEFVATPQQILTMSSFGNTTYFDFWRMFTVFLHNFDCLLGSSLNCNGKACVQCSDASGIQLISVSGDVKHKKMDKDGVYLVNRFRNAKICCRLKLGRPPIHSSVRVTGSVWFLSSKSIKSK